jgi:hypothetical protein
MSRLKSPFFWFVLAVLTTAALTALGPEKKSLGENVRIVYLYVAWMLAAEAALGLAACSGLLGILSHREHLHRWSAALGRTGIFFWVAYLPLSLWVMQANWNELFQGEPRFRIAVIFAVIGVVIQIGLSLLARPAATSLANFAFFIALWLANSQAGYVVHPSPAQVYNSGNLSLQLYFIGLVFLTMATAYFMTKWWLTKQTW